MEKKNKREGKTVQKVVGDVLRRNKSKVHRKVSTKIIPKDIKKDDNVIKKMKDNVTIKNGSETNTPKGIRRNASSIKKKKSNTTIHEKPQTNIDNLQKIYENSVKITKQIKTDTYQGKNVKISKSSPKVAKLPVSKKPESHKNIRKSSKSLKSKNSDTYQEQNYKGKSCPKQKVVSKCRDNSIKSNIPNWQDIVGSTEFKMTASLIELLQEGHKKFTASSVNAKRAIKVHLCKHPFVIIQLITVIQDCRNLTVYSNSVTILYQILVRSGLFDGNMLINIMTYLKSSENYMKLVNSLHTIDERFCESRRFKMEAPCLYVHLFEIIVVVSEIGECKRQLKQISKDTVAFMCKLLMEQCNKALLVNILKLFKIICVSKRMCYCLSSKLFYDGLCSCYKKTQTPILIVSILKLMAQTKLAIQLMSLHDNTINLLLTFINYKSKVSVCKNIVLTILYKITFTESGLKILSRPANYTRLFYVFLRNKDSNEIDYRMKTYSILKRCTSKTILQISKLGRNFILSDDIIKYVEEKIEFSESDSCNESDEFSDSDNDSSSLRFNSQEIMTEPASSTESLQEMQVFFRELAEPNKNCALTKLNVFNTTGVINEGVIAQRLCRSNKLRLAFPDAAFVIPQSEDGINSNSKFPLEYLLSKLNVKFSLTNPQIVYNLDDLCKTQEPADIPDPVTFVPQNTPETGNIGLLKFESRFECGNLRRAIQIEEFEYDLILIPNTYTCKGYQWFYFQISNMSQEMYTFNIINFTKTKHLFNDGMQPVMFSVTDYKLKRIGWKRAGERVVYYGNNYTNRSGTLQYKTLSFRIVFPHACDYVYVAYHYPYTYTRLMVNLAPFVDYKPHSICACLDKLCGTINDNNEVPLLTITAPLDYPESLKIPLHKRPIIFISARVHPGETNASWIMEGIINYLLNETEELAIATREHYIFKIIPMLNPEGVIRGNTRRGLVGLDLNRCWSKPSKIICPEIYYTKRLIEYVKRETKQSIAAFIDIHGHCQQKSFFFYGCNPAKSWNSKDHIKGDFTESLELLPQTIHTLNENIQLSSCRYDILKSRESTGRVVMWREFGITQSYTLECTYSEGYQKQNMNEKTLIQIGKSIIAALGRIADAAYKCKRSLANYGLDNSNMKNWNCEKAEVGLPTTSTSSDTLY